MISCIVSTRTSICTHKVLDELLVVHTLDERALSDSAAHSTPAEGELFIQSNKALKLGHLLRHADLLVVLRLQLLKGSQHNRQADAVSAADVEVGKVDEDLASDLAARRVSRHERLPDGVDHLWLVDSLLLAKLGCQWASHAAGPTLLFMAVRRHLSSSSSISTSGPALLRR